MDAMQVLLDHFVTADSVLSDRALRFSDRYFGDVDVRCGMSRGRKQGDAGQKRRYTVICHRPHDWQLLCARLLYGWQSIAGRLTRGLIRNRHQVCHRNRWSNVELEPGVAGLICNDPPRHEAFIALQSEQTCFLQFKGVKYQHVTVIYSRYFAIPAADQFVRRARELRRRLSGLLRLLKYYPHG